MWQNIWYVSTHTEIDVKFGDFYLLIWSLLFISLFTYLGVTNTHRTASELQGALKGLCLSLVCMDVECPEFSCL